ncbi:MAG: sigma-54-dependent Fis family transcriptional regulator [Planctomycetes bacterium]|nr:sigma-54-dependent Fis family transcriptional regulator [Planctomycetota bacterium]
MTDTAFVLVVHREADNSESIARALRDAGHACRVVQSASEATQSVRERPPDVVVTDLQVDGSPAGEEVIATTLQLAPDAEVVLIVDDNCRGRARELVTAESGPRVYDYIVKPLDLDELRLKVDRAARQAIVARQNREMQERIDQSFSFEGLIGSSPALVREIKRVRKLAKSKSTILITGETGTGKELFAQAIHTNSPRKDKPFKVVNCAAISESLLESELFGHVKGAFTGAMTNRIGILEACDGGTLFLDEIGDMPMSMQAKLLRTIETGEITPVGTNDLRHVDVRYVAATHRDLGEQIKKGAFREDLLYRLRAHCRIRIPPLRERREDIPLLIHHFLQIANEENDAHIEYVSPEATRKLTEYGWPGNVRELRSVIESMVIEAETSVLQVSDLPELIQGTREIVPVSGPHLAGWSMSDVERWHVLNTLRLAGGNREKAAKILKIGARTLYRKLKEYGSPN